MHNMCAVQLKYSFMKYLKTLLQAHKVKQSDLDVTSTGEQCIQTKQVEH